MVLIKCSGCVLVKLFYCYSWDVGGDNVCMYVFIVFDIRFISICLDNVFVVFMG